MRGIKTRGTSSAATAHTIEQGHVDTTTGDVLWRWGVDALGRPYFDDTDGADAGQEARLIVDGGVFYAEEITL